ncbi:MAG: WG repeat-containing protein [Bacteroidota bacterium]|nr:WG repeat-containing protein [Bacteroidota bacterium]
MLTRVLFLLSCFFFSVSLNAGKIEKGFEALRVYNYFEAREIFNKTLKPHPAAAGYGLAIIHTRVDNPFTDISRAHAAILIAQWGWTKSSAKEKTRIHKLGVDVLQIDMLKKRIDTLAFQLAEKKGTVPAWEEYLDTYCGSVLEMEAILKRDELAYRSAQLAGGWMDFKNFTERYPQALQRNEALAMYEQLLYETMTKDSSIVSYENFLRNYSSSPYVKLAEDRIFHFSAPANNIVQYSAFIRKYPANRNVADAWKSIYALYTADGKSTTIAQFWIDYPDFPFKETISQDLRLSMTALFPIVQNERWGFCDSAGVTRIACEYDWVEPFTEGVAAAGLQGKSGFISKSGKTAIPFEYDEVETFNKGVSQVKKNNKAGLTDRAGHLVVPVIYDEISDFHDARAVVVRDGKYGYIDMFGTEVIPCRYEKAGDFSGGYAYVVDSSKYGFVDHSGNKITPSVYDWVESFDRGIARISFNGKFGLRSVEGKELVPPDYTFISPFVEGYAMVVLDDKCGYIRRDGSFAVECIYEHDKKLTGESNFHNGRVRVKNKGKVGMVDSTGKIIVPFEFDDILPFENGLAPVKKKDKWGFIDTKNKLVIPYKYDNAGTFNDGLAFVNSEELNGAINVKQKEIIKPQFESIAFLNDYLYVNDGNAFGLMDRQGNWILPCIYSRIEFMSNTILRVEKNDKFGYYNIVRCEFLWKETGLE